MVKNRVIAFGNTAQQARVLLETGWKTQDRYPIRKEEIEMLECDVGQAILFEMENKIIGMKEVN